MYTFKKVLVTSIILIFCAVSATSCNTTSSLSATKSNTGEVSKKRRKKIKLPNIDLSHWKLTTPAGDGKGKTIDVRPPEILDYANNEQIKPYMYNDSASGALVFHAYPSSSTTANTKYSRSELREQMVPGNDNVNWTFAQGGRMKGTLAMDKVTKDEKGKYHKVIIMQIHGRLTNEQRDLIGQKDNNAPPILKIYWDNGKIRVKTKELKDINASDTEILHTDAWDDDIGYTFEQNVGFRKFTLEVNVSEGDLEVVLNNHAYKAYKNIHMERWGVFENYFKAGNYFQTTDEGAYAKVKYYELTVSH